MFATSLIMFALPISMRRIKSINFDQNSPKINLFLQKNAKYSSAGGSAFGPPCLRRLGFAPRPPKQPPITNFWLRACRIPLIQLPGSISSSLKMPEAVLLLLYPRLSFGNCKKRHVWITIHFLFCHLHINPCCRAKAAGRRSSPPELLCFLNCWRKRFLKPFRFILGFVIPMS